MKLVNDVNADYEGISEVQLKDEQLEVAVKALHVIAVMHDGDSSFMASIAIDALKELETFGYYYEQFSLEYK